MASMTFTMNDSSAGDAVGLLTVTITENPDGTVTFVVAQSGTPVGDIKAFWFDIADESLIGSLSLSANESPTGDYTPVITYQQGNDTVTSLDGNETPGGQANLQGIGYGDNGGFDVGVLITSQPPDQDYQEDDYQTFSFTVDSSTRDLTLADFMGVYFGARINSIGDDFDGDGDGDGGGSWKVVEYVPPTISISGVKYTDANGDGSLSGDQAGTPGETFTINLYKWTDTSLDGFVQENELVYVDTTETDATTGAYSFTGLPVLSGGQKYYVREVGETGWTQTFGNDGHIIDSTLGNDTNNHFGNFEKFDISGYKFEDMDGDGIKDGDEGAPSTIFRIGLYIVKDGQEPEFVTFADTDPDTGKYTFVDLGPLEEGQKYAVKELGYYEGMTFVAIDATTSDWLQTFDGGDGNPVSATSGNDTTDINFGNFNLFDISGYKWWDADGEGDWDANEVGYNGFTIYLGIDKDGDGDSDETLEQYVTQTFEGKDGYYVFDNLGPLGENQSYVIWEGTINNWIQTFPANGGVYTVTAKSGTDVVGVYGAGMGEDGSFLNFGNDMLDGPGVRTPGFWGQWLTYWDGNRDNDPKQVGAGDDDAQCGFAEHDVLTLGGIRFLGTGKDMKLLIGDFNLDGLTDEGESTWCIKLTDAIKVINASNRDMSKDMSLMLERDVVATWLNFLAGNEVPEDELNEAIDWINDPLNAGVVKASSDAWSGSGGGNALHMELDEYNNYGTDDGVQIAGDGDCANEWIV